MNTHCEAVSDFAMRKYIRLLFTFLNKRLYEYYPQRPVRSADFSANPSDQTCFFNEPLLYVYYLLLVISLLFKVYIFPQVEQICYFTSCILGTSTTFRLQKETARFCMGEMFTRK